MQGVDIVFFPWILNCCWTVLLILTVCSCHVEYPTSLTLLLHLLECSDVVQLDCGQP